MRIADLIAFITGAPPDFHGPDAAVEPGDRFGRFEEPAGWTYVEVSALDDRHLREGCVYARAFSHEQPAGREGYCHLSQLALRIDDDTWDALRASGWPTLGVVLGLGADDPSAPGSFDG